MNKLTWLLFTLGWLASMPITYGLLHAIFFKAYPYPGKSKLNALLWDKSDSDFAARWCSFGLIILPVTIVIELFSERRRRLFKYPILLFRNPYRDQKFPE